MLWPTPSIPDLLLMMLPSSSLKALLIPTLTGALVSPPLAVLALPNADNTVGTQPVLISPTQMQINGGTTQGQNLFHSFESFNISTGERVYFLSPTGINHIFSRVTGNSRSEINGLLGTTGSNADLFLINPNGVVFGADASLDVRGSLIVTTADGIELGTEGIFSASTPTSDRLLDVSPSAFFFNSTGTPSEIVTKARPNPLFPFLGGGLTVPRGEALLLIGGAVLVDSGQLTAAGGRVEIGAIGGSGTVGFNAENHALTIPTTIDRATVTLQDNASINVAASGGGDVVIYADNFNVLNNSAIEVGIPFGFGTIRGGDIQIDATGTLTVSDNSKIQSEINILFGAATGGDITIRAQNLRLVNSGEISNNGVGSVDVGDIILEVSDTLSLSEANPSDTQYSRITAFIFGLSAQSSGGDIVIDAKEIELHDGALIGSSIPIGFGFSNNANITTGNVTLRTDSLQLEEGSQVASTTIGAGDAGNVTVTARDLVVVDGTSTDGRFRSGISSQVAPGAQGNGGNVLVVTDNLAVTGGAEINASTFGRGNAGNVTLVVNGLARLDGISADGRINSTVLSAVAPGAQGNGGTLQVFAENLTVTNGAVLASGVFGTGNAGDVLIEVQDQTILEGVGASGLVRSGVSSEVGIGAQGQGGTVRLSTRTLEVTNGAALTSGTSGNGNAGDVIVEAQETVVFDGVGPNGRFVSNARSSVEQQGQGNGGDIRILGETVTVRNGAQLIASTLGQGNAGNVVIVAPDQIRLTEGQILVASDSDSPAGNLTLTAAEVNLTQNSFLSAESATVDGGNIFINLDRLLLLRDGSQITATAGTAQGGGNGGNINITAPFIVAIPLENSDIKANAFQGTGGQVNITANGVFGIEPRPNLTPLSDITASSDQGVSGFVSLNSLNTGFIENSLTELPETVIDPDSLVANSCVARRQQTGTTLTINGSSPTEAPTDVASSAYLTGDVRTIPNITDDGNRISAPSPWQPGDGITEPAGVYLLADGRLVMSQECL